MSECYEYEQTKSLKSLEEISLYDIMGEDHGVWIQKNPKYGFDMEIDNEQCELVIKEFGMHPAAIEGLAVFCRQYLRCYKKTKGGY